MPGKSQKCSQNDQKLKVNSFNLKMISFTVSKVKEMLQAQTMNCLASLC